MSSTTFTASTATRSADGLRAGRLLWAGPAIAVAAAVATSLVAWIALALGLAPADFPLLQIGVVFASTIGQVLLGAVVFALIIRFARRPLRTWQIVAGAALLLSFLSPLSAYSAGMSPIPVPVFPFSALLVLFVLHTVAGLIALFGLPALAREK